MKQASKKDRKKQLKKSAVRKPKNQHLQKRRSKKDAKSKRKAQYLATLPKSKIKRVVYRFHPRRLYKYWFSRDGLLMALKLTGTGFGFMIVLVLGLFAYYRRGLPDPKNVSNQLFSRSTEFYDKTGEHLLYKLYGNENRTIVDFDQISDSVKNATVAVEDKDYYNHGGVSFSGIARAAWSNLTSGDSTNQGGSTITQQFIKNSLLTTEQTYSRKIQEIILSIELERLYSKDEILGFYLNEIPYGPQEYGIQAAAQSYFRKDALDLSIAESTLLAALPQAPTFFSPYGDNTDLLVERQHTIINLMQDQGYITAEDAQIAKDVDVMKEITPISERSLYSSIFAPHFVLEVQRQLEEDPNFNFGAAVVQNGGLKIITTLDYDLQKIAEKAIADADDGGFCDRGGNCGDNAALVATDVATGQITAMVGSRRFTYPGYGSFNAALADRQPGSSFKPFDYSQLFYNDRWGPDSTIYDTKTTWGAYHPEDFDFKYRNKMLVRQAIGESRNIPAVKAADIAGIQNVVNLAMAMGNKSLGDDAAAPGYNLNYALGGGEVKLAEHANAYGTFARAGKYLPLSYIISVENSDGDNLFQWEKQPGNQVLDPQIAYLMTNILTDDNARSGTFGRGNQNLVVPGLNHAVKTGSTDRSVDGLMMGYSAYISVGVWVGNHDNTPMDSITSNQTGPIFTQFLREASIKRGYDFTKEIQARPAGIQAVKMSTDTGYAATDKTVKTFTGLFPSWYIPETGEDENTYTIDTISGFLATECTPTRAKEEKIGKSIWPEVLPGDYRYDSWSKTAGYGNDANKPTKDDDVHDCSDLPPNVSVSSSKIADGVYEYTATVSKGTHKLKTLNFRVGDQIVLSENVDPTGGSYTYTHNYDANGSYDVSADIIDEVLYDNTNSHTETVTAADSTFLITSHTDGQTGVNISDLYVWDAFSGSTSYNFCYKIDTNVSYSCNDTGILTQYTPSLPPLHTNKNYDIKIESFNSTTLLRTSPQITITTAP